MDGWMGGKMEAKAGLRIAYSNQKLKAHQIIQVCGTLASNVTL